MYGIEIEADNYWNTCCSDQKFFSKSGVAWFIQKHRDQTIISGGRLDEVKNKGKF